MTVHAALYGRNSSAEDASLERQASENTQAAQRYGWQPHHYEDPASASRFSKRQRPGWDQLLADVAARKLNIVVLWESSRGDRKLADWARFLDACRETGTHIYVTTHDRTYDLARSRDWRSLAEDGIDSAYESEKISERSRSGVALAAAAGIPYGRVPYGYARTYSRVAGRKKPLPCQVPEPTEAAIVREVITRIAANEPIVRILRDFAARGITTRAGKPWARSSITRLVTNGEVYIGKRRHNGGPLLDGDWEALVSADVFWKAARVLADPARKTAALSRGGIRPGAAKWLLSYIARCGKCGAPLSIQYRYVARSKVAYYRCPQVGGCAYAPVEWLDGEVAHRLLTYLAEPAQWQRFTAGDDSAASAARDEAAAERERLAGFEAAAIAGEISAAVLARVAAGIEARIAELDALVTSASVPPVLGNLYEKHPDTYRRIDMLERWEALALPARRALIAATCAPTLAPASPASPAGSGGLLDPARVAMNWA